MSANDPENHEIDSRILRLRGCAYQEDNLKSYIFYIFTSSFYHIEIIGIIRYYDLFKIDQESATGISMTSDAHLMMHSWSIRI